MADFWNTDWLTRSEMFAPLRPVAAGLPAIGWPDLDLLNALAEDRGRRIVNAQGMRVRFVPQAPKSKSFEAAFEPRTYLRGEVQVRAFDWHDLFNALLCVRPRALLQGTATLRRADRKSRAAAGARRIP